MSRERAVRLASALGVVACVGRPSPRSQWRAYINGEVVGGRYAHQSDANAWRAVAAELERRAYRLCDALRLPRLAAIRAGADRVRAEEAVEAARAALEAATAKHREAVAAHLAAREALGVAHLAASPEARAAFAALTEGL